MRCYLIRDHHVTVLVSSASSSDKDLIQSIKDLDQVRFPVTRLMAIWNALPGVEPIKRFSSRAAAVKKIWAALEALPISSVRTNSKQARMVAMLKRPAGASMDQMISTTGWQAHSVRGVMSGVLKKKLGFALSSEMKGDRRIYRIAA